MEFKKVYQVKIFVREDEYPDEAGTPYTATLLTTASLHFANMVYKLYSTMYDKGEYCDALAQHEQGQWEIEDIYVEEFNLI